jgi:glyoxylase-like metal-dependent hydrolase (beta-lactamase superfamily II)
MRGKKIIQLTVGPIATNCWIYPLSNEKAAVIDPGDEADLIISTLKKLNLCPDFIILTHGHFDHIGAVPLLAAAFNSASPQIAIHRLDSEYLGADSYKAHSLSIKAAMGDTSFIDTLWEKMPAADILLEEDSTIGPLTVLQLPGHTPGSAAFYDKEEGVLFTGDTLFEGSWGRTDLPGGNEGQIMASLSRLFKMDPNVKVCPGHGNTTTIGREASNGLTAL